MPPKKNATPVKPPEGSTMVHEESEDKSFRVSQLEKNFKGMVRTIDLYNIEKKLEESMEIIVNLVQHPEKKLRNDDNVCQGTHDERNSSHFEKPSFHKSTPGGFDSNIGSN